MAGFQVSTEVTINLPAAAAARSRMLVENSRISSDHNTRAAPVFTGTLTIKLRKWLGNLNATASHDQPLSGD
jgi:hypothetical protein